MALALKHFLTLVVVIVIGCFVDSSNGERSVCVQHMQDGCSIPIFKHLPDWMFPYKATFRPACMRHDVCYVCVSFVDEIIKKNEKLEAAREFWIIKKT